MAGWTNEDGEPIMDGAAWRFEQNLDAQSAEEDYAERFLDGGWEQDECPNCGSDECDGDCGPEVDRWDAMEDQWLDGSYEE